MKRSIVALLCVMVLLVGWSASTFAQVADSNESVWNYYLLESAVGSLSSFVGFMSFGVLGQVSGLCDEPFLCGFFGSAIGGTTGIAITGSIVGVEGNLLLASLGTTLGGGIGFILDMGLILSAVPGSEFFPLTHVLAGTLGALGFNLGARLANSE